MPLRHNSTSSNSGKTSAAILIITSMVSTCWPYLCEGLRRSLFSYRCSRIPITTAYSGRQRWAMLEHLTGAGSSLLCQIYRLPAATNSRTSGFGSSGSGQQSIRHATNLYTEQREEMLFFATVFALYFVSFSLATTVLWEGRAPFNYTEADIDESFGPYLRYVVAPTVWPNSYMKGIVAL